MTDEYKGPLHDMGTRGPVSDDDHYVDMMRDRSAVEREIKRIRAEWGYEIALLEARLDDVLDPLVTRAATLDEHLILHHRRRHADGEWLNKRPTPFGSTVIGPKPKGSIELIDNPGRGSTQGIVEEWAAARTVDVHNAAPKPTLSKNKLLALAVLPDNLEPNTRVPVVTKDGEQIPGVYYVIPERTAKVVL